MRNSEAIAFFCNKKREALLFGFRARSASLATLAGEQDFRVTSRGMA